MWAPKIAKLVYNSNNYDLWYANNYSIHGVYKPTNIAFGGPTLYVHIPLHRPHILDILLGSSNESEPDTAITERCGTAWNGSNGHVQWENMYNVVPQIIGKP
jgi:hypothetical protein